MSVIARTFGALGLAALLLAGMPHGEPSMRPSGAPLIRWFGERVAPGFEESRPALLYSTYLGGCRGHQGIQDIAIGADGNAFVAGDYPWDCDRGAPNAFVEKFGPTGARLSGTTFGGHFSDIPAAIALDAEGNIFVTGSTGSGTCCRPFPVVNALQSANAGGTDVFVVKLDPTGGTILYSTFLGGTGDDRGADIEVDALGRIYVTGQTTSTDFPTEHAWQPALAGASDATYFPAAEVERNVIVGGNPANYPTDNFFPGSLSEVGFADPSAGDYSLREDSRYRGAGTGQADPGVDLRALPAALAD